MKQPGTSRLFLTPLQGRRNSEKSEQTDHPDNHDPTRVKVSMQDSVELRKISPKAGHLLLRMFLTRKVWEGPESLSQRDLALVVLTLD